MDINDALNNVLKNAEGETVVDCLKEALNLIDQEEGFTPELLEFVDLTITFSPVIAIRGEVREVKAVPSAKPGWWVIDHPMIESAVDENSLRRMHLRFLMVSRGLYDFVKNRGTT